MNTTDLLIRYTQNLTFDGLPEKTVRHEAHCLNDMLACQLAATTIDEPSILIAEYASRFQGDCTLFANGKKSSPEFAALANGTLSHALDFDDSHDAIVHPSGVIVPVVLALSEYLGNVSGKELITALVIGTDLSCRLAIGSPAILQYGWNSPSIFEAMGAVFGASKLMKLSDEQILDAIAITMTKFTCSGESMQAKGSVIRTMREGFAAQAVVEAVLLAKLGIHARFETPFEGKYGFFTMYSRGEYYPDAIVKDLGKSFEVDNVSFKPWPSCKGTHSSITALLEIMNENNLSADDIVSIDIVGEATTAMTMDPYESKLRPESSAIAKMSLPFVLGTLMKYGSIGMDSFTKDRLCDSDITKYGSLVHVTTNPKWGKAENQFIDMKVKTQNGEFIKHMESSMGGTGFPLTTDQVENKFYSCCRQYRKPLTDNQIKNLFDFTMNIEKQDNVTELFAML